VRPYDPKGMWGLKTDLTAFAVGSKPHSDGSEAIARGVLEHEMPARGRIPIPVPNLNESPLWQTGRDVEGRATHARPGLRTQHVISVVMLEKDAGELQSRSPRNGGCRIEAPGANAERLAN